MPKVGIAEAARMLGLSQDTVRKRVRAGELVGERETAPGGFRWMVDLDPDATAGEVAGDPWGNGRSDALVDVLMAQLQDLREQLDARTREISELHQLMGARSLNPGRPWWRRWL